jgi:hypothetical protein
MNCGMRYEYRPMQIKKEEGAYSPNAFIFKLAYQSTPPLSFLHVNHLV